MKNQIKTIVLLGVLTVLMVAVGGALGRGFLLLFGALALAMNLGAYFWSDRLVLRMHRAREMQPGERPDLHDMVTELSVAAGIPRPRLFLLPDPQPNAFATGRNPEKGVVAVTEGLLRLMSPREVRGVIAHEIAHIKNRDVLVATVAAMLASAIAWIGNALQFSFLFGGAQDDEGGSPLGLLATAILAPIGATLVQLGVSRSREYLADETAARLTGDPEGLASALERLGIASERVPAAQPAPATAGLFIVNPLGGGRAWSRLFSTHPQIADRVRRLRNLQTPGSSAYRDPRFRAA
jgi:heat shock protein HtpX